MWRVLRLARTFLGQRQRGRTSGPAALVGAISLVVGLAGCSSGSSSTEGTQTVTGQISRAAAADLINSDIQAPLTFLSLVFAGPITTSATNASIGGDTSSSPSQTIVTSAGNFTVTLTIRSRGQNQRSWTGEHNGNCTFRQDAQTGNYIVDGSQSTGKFAGAIGNGSYAITILGAAPLLPGKTT